MSCSSVTVIVFCLVGVSMSAAEYTEIKGSFLNGHYSISRDMSKSTIGDLKEYIGGNHKPKVAGNEIDLYQVKGQSSIKIDNDEAPISDYFSVAENEFAAKLKNGVSHQWVEKLEHQDRQRNAPLTDRVRNIFSDLLEQVTGKRI